MSHRRTPYKPRRDRRELMIAVLCALSVVIVTAVLVWVFRPNKDLGSDKSIFPEPTTTVMTETTAPTVTTTP
ncbi:MAG: hypothetical protein WEB19_01110 [Acidimicrobiia bacterium]